MRSGRGAARPAVFILEKSHVRTDTVGAVRAKIAWVKSTRS